LDLLDLLAIQALKDLKGSLVNQELKDIQELKDHRELKDNLVNPVNLVQQDNLDRVDSQVPKDQLVRMAKLEWVVLQVPLAWVKMVPLVLPVLWVLPEKDKALWALLDPVEVMEDKDLLELMVPSDQLDLLALVGVMVDKDLKDPQGIMDSLDQRDLLDLPDPLEAPVDQDLLEQLEQLDQLVQWAQEHPLDLAPLFRCLDPHSPRLQLVAHLTIQSALRVEELVLMTIKRDLLQFLHQSPLVLELVGLLNALFRLNLLVKCGSLAVPRLRIGMEDCQKSVLRKTGIWY